MTNAKHTPGPLGLKEGFDRDSGLKLHRVVKGVSIVAECYGINSEANARLIASAPDLLAFVERVADVLDYYDQNTGPERDNTLCELLAEAIAAIAKARGTD